MAGKPVFYIVIVIIIMVTAQQPVAPAAVMISRVVSTMQPGSFQACNQTLKKAKRLQDALPQ